MDSTPPKLTPSALADMDRSLTKLTDRSAELEEFYRDQTVLLSSTPSVWPVRGYLSATFGNRIDPFTAQKDFHPGIDISTPIGTKVQAPADGIVISTGQQGGYGNALVIDHGYGVVTRYGHLDSFAVKPGQRVKRGEVIAFVGSTGRSTGPHLHYEVWVRDQAQNPIHFILDEYRTFWLGPRSRAEPGRGSPGGTPLFVSGDLMDATTWRQQPLARGCAGALLFYAAVVVGLTAVRLAGSAHPEVLKPCSPP